MGSKTQTSTGTQSSTTGALPQFANLLSQQGTNTANIGANTNPASLVAPVAGFTAPQTQGFDVAQQQAAQGLSGLASPYLQNAASAYGGISPVNAQSINAQFNAPGENQFTNALMAQLQQANGVTGQQVNSNAALQGALTGDRSQIALASADALNNQNAATALSNYQTGQYNTAANTALQNNNTQLGVGNGYANLGTTAQNTGLANVASLLGIGGQQQGQNQAVNNYGASVAAAPLSLQQWLNSQLAGVSGAAGSTSSGTSSQTTPGPNLISQLLGGATALFGAGSGTKSSATGGRIRGYDGGGPVSPLDGWDQFSSQPIAALQSKPLPAMPQASSAQSSTGSSSMPSAQSLANAGKGISNLWSSLNTTAGAPTMFGPDGAALDSGWSTTVSPTMAGAGNFLDSSLGGIGSAFSGGMDALGSMGVGLAGMGADAMAGLGSMGAAAAGGLGDLTALLPFLLLKRGGRVKGYDDGGMVGDDTTPALMRDPTIMDAAPNDDGVWDTTEMPGATVATQGSYQPTSGTAPAASGGSDGLFGNPLGLTDAGRQGLIAAGLGMMASRSPFIGTAIGEGGLQGVNAYQKQRALDTTEAYRKATIANQGQRLANQADAIANRLKLGTRNSDIAQQKADQTNDYHTRMADIADQRAKEITSRIIDPATRADMFAKDIAATEFKADPTQNLTARTDYWRNYWHQRYEPPATAPGGTAAPLAPVPRMSFSPPSLPSGGNDMLAKARDAIARGADRSAVIQRLQSQGIDASGL